MLCLAGPACDESSTRARLPRWVISFHHAVLPTCLLKDGLLDFGNRFCGLHAAVGRIIQLISVDAAAPVAHADVDALDGGSGGALVCTIRRRGGGSVRLRMRRLGGLAR